MRQPGRKRRGWKSWTVVVTVLLWLAFALSLGPYLELHHSRHIPPAISRATFSLDEPLFFLREFWPEPVRSAFDW